MNSEDIEGHVNNFLKPFHINITSTEAKFLESYINSLLKWNKAKRLVGKKTAEEILYDLILDSILPVVWLKDSTCLIDIGSGAGIPGIPLKILLRHLRLILVEPNIKKITFLRWIIREIGLSDVIVVNKKIQQLQPEDFPFECDTVTSRALFDPVTLIGIVGELSVKIRRLILYTSWKYNTEKSWREDIKPFRLKEVLTYLIPPGKKRKLLLLDYQPVGIPNPVTHSERILH